MRPHIYPIHETTKEETIKDSTETITNPFDDGKHIVGLGNRCKKDKYQKVKEKLQERIDNEPELDIKEEIRKGNLVTIIDDN